MLKSISLTRALVVKEFRAQAADTWTGILLIVPVVILGFAALATIILNSDRDGAWLSTTLARVFAVIEVCLLLVLVAVQAASAFTRERRGSTWEVLLLGRISARAILGAKFAATVASGALMVAATVPLYALCRVYGPSDTLGVSRVAVVLLATVVFAAAAGMLVSTMSRGLAHARITGLAATLVAGPGLALLTVRADGPLPFQPLTPVDTALAVLSPVAAVISALSRDGTPLFYPLGLGIGVSLWIAYIVVALLISTLLVAISGQAVERTRAHLTEPATA